MKFSVLINPTFLAASALTLSTGAWARPFFGHVDTPVQYISEPPPAVVRHYPEPLFPVSPELEAHVVDNLYPSLSAQELLLQQQQAQDLRDLAQAQQRHQQFPSANQFSFFMNTFNTEPVLYTPKAVSALDPGANERNRRLYGSTEVVASHRANNGLVYVVTRSKPNNRPTFVGNPYLLFIFNPSLPVVPGRNPELVTFSYSPTITTFYASVLGVYGSFLKSSSRFGISKVIVDSNNIQIVTVDEIGAYKSILPPIPRH